MRRRSNEALNDVSNMCVMVVLKDVSNGKSKISIDSLKRLYCLQTINKLRIKIKLVVNIFFCGKTLGKWEREAHKNVNIRQTE